MLTIQGTDYFNHPIDSTNYPDGFFGAPSAVSSPNYDGHDNTLQIISTGGDIGVRHNITGSPTIGWAGFAFRCDDPPSTQIGVANFGAAAGTSGNIWIGSGGLFAAVGSDITASVPISLNVWYWLEMLFDVSGGTRELRWRINGVDQEIAAEAVAASTLAFHQLLSFSGDESGATNLFSVWKWGSATVNTDWRGEPTPTYRINTHEGGTDEVTISTTNSGGASGDPYSTVNIGAGNGIVYDDVATLKGNRAARIDLANNPGTVDEMGWNFEAVEELWGYFYIYRTGTFTGPTTIRVASMQGSGSGIARLVIARDSPYNLAFVDANFGNQATTVAGIPLNTLMRVGWRVKCSDTVGEYEIRIYEGDSDTPVTNGTVVGTNVDTNVSCDGMRVGCSATWTGGAYSFWLDNVNINTEGRFGPLPQKQTYYGYRRRSYR